MRVLLVTMGCVLGIAGATALGQPAELSLVVPDGITEIRAGQTVTVEVLVDQVFSPALLRSYQAQIEIVPGPGSTGSLVLADPRLPPDPNDAIFIDTDRPDWVFAGQPAFPVVNVELLRIGAAMFSGGVEVTSAKYCGTYIFEASADAEGDFQICFAPLPNTTLFDEFGNAIPYSVVPAGCLVITVLPPTATPSNDDCVDSNPISDGTTAFTTENGTTDGADLGMTCDEGNGVSIGQDIWFDHVATCTGLLTISTCDNATFDTRLAVYGTELPSCICPTDNTSLLACNDDAPGCGSGTSELSMPVTEGSCYTVRVGGVGAAEGTGSLTIMCSPDLCTNAVPVSVGTTTPGSTANTEVNDIGPDCGTGPVDSPGVWYSVTGTGNLMTASLCFGAAFDTRLTVYEGGCGALTCVADADDTCGNQESVSWCSTAGTEYLILVHGVAGASGPFGLEVTDQGCSDANACTTDACAGGACVHQNNFDDTLFCCAPATGDQTLIDDANPCTNDLCNPNTGIVNHTPIPDGPEPACDDGDLCTFDECQGGSCVNVDINGLSCTDDVDCPGDSNLCVGDLCECAGATLELIADDGPMAVSGCYTVGESLSVRVELGPQGVPFLVPEGQEIIGAQFFLEYDTSTLIVESVQPGAVLGTGSPFAIEIQEVVDDILGTIDYLVAVNFGDPGTRSPATVAVITFQALNECQAYVRYRPAGPNGEPNVLVTVGGGEVEPVPVDLAPVNIDFSPPTLAPCPLDITVAPDPGLLSAVVSWVAPTATDTCDAGLVAVVCDPPDGSVFDSGTTQVTCTATDSCGLEDGCTFDVTVEPQLLTVDVELSATMASGPFERCITFELWDCDGPPEAQPLTISETLTFVNGLGTLADLPIPSGAWECLSARDGLHTLSSTAPDFTTADGTLYTGSLVGSRAAGGHWLVGGNLNDDPFIDIRDFGVFFPFFLTVAAADTPCGTVGPHANINGDSVVDLLDLVFVTGNSLQTSEPGCCATGTVSTSIGPRMSISVDELRRAGQYDMIAADINRDGFVDVNDIIAMIEGDVPPQPGHGSLHQREQGKTGRSEHRRSPRR